MTTKLQMVCGTCGSADVQADAYASWNDETQAWELTNTFDKGAVCGPCDGECRIKEVPLDEWDSQQNITQELLDLEYHAEELADGNWKAIINEEGVGTLAEATTDQWGSTLATRDEALDEARRKVMEINYG